jgi:ParB family transcriptional regulator, chromosome partitioning protein
MNKARQKGLGRGLDALLGGDRAPADKPAASAPPGAPTETLPIGQLQPGQYQPRTRMDESALQELADSIRTHGVLQPILVRPVGAQRWEIIAGERRWRAARLAGLGEVPVLVREVPDEQALQWALIENIQREDLNPLESAQAIRRLVDEFGYSHEQAAEAIGRSRSATTNLLRLLNLADPVQTMLLAGDLDMGHARALLALDGAGQIMAAQQVIERRLTVRETERLVHQILTGAVPGSTRAAGTPPAADMQRLEKRLSDTLAAPVRLRADARGRGRMTIAFGSIEQFQGLLERLGLAGDD